MNGYKAYCLFLALKNHFRSESYDYFKYQGKTRANRASFDMRGDRFWYESLANNYTEEQLIDFYVANLLKGRKYIIEMIKLNEDEAKEAYIEYVKRKESFTYCFEQDLDLLISKVSAPKSLFRLRKNGYPEIITLYLNGSVPIQTLSVLNDFIMFSKVFDKKIGQEDIVWSDVRMKIQKIKSFIKYDVKKIENLMKRKMLNKENN